MELWRIYLDDVDDVDVPQQLSGVVHFCLILFHSLGKKVHFV